jgi:hypothetical protein
MTEMNWVEKGMNAMYHVPRIEGKKKEEERQDVPSSFHAACILQIIMRD